MYSSSDTTIPELKYCETIIFKPLRLYYTTRPTYEEGNSYSACTFELNYRGVVFRVGKTTPKKDGHFVTLWNRNNKGDIVPFDKDDYIGLFIICVTNGDKFGQFVFPKSILVEKNILSQTRIGGKRAMRIYSPWSFPKSKQAINTQSWQIKYFIDFSKNDNIDMDHVHKLYRS